MRLLRLPIIHGDFNFIKNSSYGWKFFIGLIGGFLLLLLCIPWAPKYPVQAYVDTIPSMVKIEAPVAGVLQGMELKIGRTVIQGQKICSISVLQGLLHHHDFEKMHVNLSKQLKFLKLDIEAQTRKLTKIKRLWQKRSVTFEQYQEAKAELRHRTIEYQKLLAEFWKHEYESMRHIHAPITGKIIQLVVQNQSMVKKNELLLWVEPEKFQWQLRLKIPVMYKKFVYPGAQLRLQLPDSNKIKRYSLKAKIIHFSGVIIHKKKSDWIEAYAVFEEPKLWNKQLMPHMSLPGYLLAPRHLLMIWLYKIIFSI